jgi:hypothetical protein
LPGVAATAEYQACAVCARTILRGERTADYVDTEGHQALVCPLCKARAEAEGWLPAAVAAQIPAPLPRRRRGAAALRERLTALRAEHSAAPDKPQAPPEPPRRPSPLEVFNQSGEVRKVAGLRKSLGEPRVTVRHESGTEVITVAWDLSWYRWSVRGDNVKQLAKGNEISELPVEDRAWNAQAAEDGTLSLA